MPSTAKRERQVLGVHPARLVGPPPVPAGWTRCHAYLSRKHRFCRERYVKDFCAGFRAGYEDMCNGSDGCTPAFPPNSYRGWQYQSSEGQAKSQAWFAGYPHGARAAEEEGVVHWNQVPMSAGTQAKYQQAGVLDHEGALYPIPESTKPIMPGANPLRIQVSRSRMRP